MFFVGKKVVYLSLYSAGQRIKPSGFLQMTGTGEKIKFSLQIKNMREIPDAGYEIYICNKEDCIQIGHVMLQEGNGYFEKSMEPVTIRKIVIKLSEKEQIIGHLASINETEEKQTAEIRAEEETLHYREPVAEILSTDKWEQILNKYSNIHPFRDDRVFVSLNLEELMILPEKYQRLIHNSFLLHGFYNYRHLILGKDYRLGNHTEKCFYLGVPGVYFEREKQVAVMFGFEGFECAGAVEIGKFGYYVKEVSI